MYIYINKMKNLSNIQQTWQPTTHPSDGQAKRMRDVDVR